MSFLKRNFVWNSLLVISGYLFPLLTFPYITRVLGAENLGMANFAMSVVDYAILFSSLGLATIGYRYIPQCNDDKEKRNDVFSHLVTIHILMTLAILVVYTLCIFFIPKLSADKPLYFFGATKVIFNVFLVEWLFQGMQDFRYITLRTILVRTLYVIGVFVFVRNKNDYDIYFYLTIAQVVINAIINWKYTKKYVSFRFKIKGCGEYLFPVFSMGVNRILLSFYVTFNVLYLGFVCGNASVGYFTTATKLYGIFLSFLSAYNGVVVPYLNNLFGRHEMEQFTKMVNYSFSIIGFLSIPIVIVCVMLAPEIIRIMAGEGYEAAILPFRIVIFQVFFIGIAQILENQILLSLKKFKEVLICTSICIFLSLIILFSFTPKYGEVAAAYAVAIPHVLEVILLYYYTRQSLDVSFPYADYFYHIIVCIPIIVFCMLLKNMFNNYLIILALGGGVSVLFYLIVEYFIIKQDLLVTEVNKLLRPSKTNR